jgi:hypothetical protein
VRSALPLPRDVLSARRRRQRAVIPAMASKAMSVPAAVTASRSTDDPGSPEPSEAAASWGFVTYVPQAGAGLWAGFAISE